METSSAQPQHSRIGMHYFPDTLHYRETDLQTWLPRIQSLGVEWLTLIAPHEWVIPESFLGRLIDAGIQPILHFQFSISNPPSTDELPLVFESYAKRGARYAVLFDRPNSRSSWSMATWTQEDLVERFLDRFIPCAEAALEAGLIPVFPPLEPGGNYWDTSFLRAALVSLERRKKTEILENLVLSANAWTSEHSLNWGAGGPQRWPGARPYFTPQSEEDQRGFHIFDWYLSISEAALGKKLPLLLFGLGSPADPWGIDDEQELPASHALEAVMIARLLDGETITDPSSDECEIPPVDAEVLAGNFWLLAAAEDSPARSLAWYQADGDELPAVDTFQNYSKAKKVKKKPAEGTTSTAARPIQHYLLLPLFEWGVADWHLDIIRPFVKKFQPTIGFSIEEAGYAERVTVIGGPEQFSEEALCHLRNSGCLVERISGDGTQIATILAER